VLTAHKPDLVILQEATDTAVVEQIGREAGFPHFVSRQDYSVAFLSKSKPTSYEWHGPRGIRSPFLEVSLQESGLRTIGVHLTALLVNRLERRRIREVKALLNIVGDDLLHLLIGDFNTTLRADDAQIEGMPLWLRLLILANGGIRPRALQLLLDSGYIDVFRHLNPHGEAFTLPTPDPNSRLDYAFVPKELINRVKACLVIREPDAVNIASDHYPLLVEVN
jgi:exonuclease III